MAGVLIVPEVVGGGRLEMGRGGMLRVDARVTAQAALETAQQYSQAVSERVQPPVVTNNHPLMMMDRGRSRH